jgi:hypothetical protein
VVGVGFRASFATVKGDFYLVVRVGTQLFLKNAKFVVDVDNCHSIKGSCLALIFKERVNAVCTAQ